jgi:phospholipase C
MRFIARILLLLVSLAPTFTYAQTIPPGTFKHIIIVVQENRTPDNLFGAGGRPCGSEDPFETGADIETGGFAFVPQSNGTVQYGPICNSSLPLSAWDPNIPTPKVVDPDHSYGGWGQDYAGGSLNGFCHEYGSYAVYLSTCPSYSYVQESDVQPYLAIATNYGWANYVPDK